MRKSAVIDLQLVETDDAAYAAHSGRFADCNAAHATCDWKSDSLVLVEDGTIVAGGRAILNRRALEVRGSTLTVRCSELTAQA